MNTEHLIAQYLSDHGLNITPYVDTFRHTIPGTISIISIRMYGFYGHYDDWVKLMSILDEPSCPIKMEPIKSSPGERPRAFDRLVWIDN